MSKQNKKKHNRNRIKICERCGNEVHTRNQNFKCPYCGWQNGEPPRVVVTRGRLEE